MGTKGWPGHRREQRAPVLPAVLTVAVLVLAVLAAGFLGDLSAEPVLGPPATTAPQESSPVPSTTDPPEPVPDDGERIIIDGGTAAAALLLLGMAGLALLVRYLLRSRREPASEDGILLRTEVRQQGSPVPVAGTLPSWAEESAAALTSATDTSDAVIRCWLDLERVCAEAGAGRGAAQTTSDFAAAVAERFDLPAQPLAALNRLYQRARFARTGVTGVPAGALGPADRDTAAESLDALVHALASWDSRTGTDR